MYHLIDEIQIVTEAGASHSLVLSDSSKLIKMTNGAANTVDIPLNASVAFPIGIQIAIMQYGAGQTSLNPTGGVTVRSAGSADKLASQYSMAVLTKIGTDEWHFSGDITT